MTDLKTVIQEIVNTTNRSVTKSFYELGFTKETLENIFSSLDVTFIDFVEDEEYENVGEGEYYKTDLSFAIFQDNSTKEYYQILRTYDSWSGTEYIVHKVVPKEIVKTVWKNIDIL